MFLFHLISELHIPPIQLTDHFTSNLTDGLFLPIPTLPLALITIRFDPAILS